MDVINIDTIGPLRKDNAGNEYILVIVDCFTRWTELYPLADLYAITAAKKLIEFSGRFGIPTLIRTDRGPQFANSIIDELIKLLGSSHELTLAYSKEENGIVERTNREVNRHLRDMLYDSRVYDSWSFAYLPLVMRIINSEVHSSTGVSPAQLLFGNAIQLQRELFKNSTSPNESVVINHDYFINLVRQQEILLQVAAETQRENDIFRLKIRSSGSDDFIYDELTPNTYVLWNDPSKSPSKLEYCWKGPFLLKKRDKNSVTLECLINFHTWDTHISMVRPYKYDSQFQFLSPQQVAARDLDEYFVEVIVDHRLVDDKADIRKTSSYEFLVKWVGFPGQDSWEPFSSLCNNHHLHTYVLQNDALKSIHPRLRNHLRSMEKRDENKKTRVS
jgi:hypothetical protein